MLSTDIRAPPNPLLISEQSATSTMSNNDLYDPYVKRDAQQAGQHDGGDRTQALQSVSVIARAVEAPSQLLELGKPGIRIG